MYSSCKTETKRAIQHPIFRGLSLFCVWYIYLTVYITGTTNNGGTHTHQVKTDIEDKEDRKTKRWNLA